MSTLTQSRLRIAADLFSFNDFSDVLRSDVSGYIPKFRAGDDVRVELALFDNDALLDISDVASLKLEIKPIEVEISESFDDDDESDVDLRGPAYDAGLLVSKTVLAEDFYTTLTQTEWDSDEADKAHAVFELSATDSLLAPGDRWLTISLQSTATPAISRTVCAGRIRILGGGQCYEAPEPTTVGETFYNATESDARFLRLSESLGDLSDTALARDNLGLGNVDDTADADKPISSAQRAVLDLKADASVAKRATPSVQLAETAPYFDPSTKTVCLETPEHSGALGAYGLMNPDVVDFQKMHPSWPDAYRYRMLLSTDHGPGGIFAYYAATLDGIWYPAATVYADTDVVAWATSNSITLPTVADELTSIYDHGTQCETPRSVLRDDGTDFLFTHEYGATGGYNQTTVFATSSDGFNYTYQGLAIEVPRDMHGDGHIGYMTQPFRVGNQWHAFTICGGAEATVYVLCRSNDLEHWTVDQEEFYGLLPKAYGQFGWVLRWRGGATIQWRGRLWHVSRYGKDITEGGGSFEDRLVAFPLSSDLKRAVSIPSIVSEPGTNSLNEILCSECCLITDDDGQLYCFYRNRDDSGSDQQNSIVRVVADPGSSVVPPAIFEPDADYAKLVLDHEGKLSGYGAKNLEMVLQDYQFGGLTSLPSDMAWSAWDYEGTTWDYSGDANAVETIVGFTAGRGYLQLENSGAAVQHGIHGMEVNPIYFREVWVDLLGLNHLRGTDMIFGFGFHNDDDTYRISASFRDGVGSWGPGPSWFIREPGESDVKIDTGSYLLVDDYDASDNSATTLNRKLSVGLIQRHDPASNAEEYFFAFTVNDTPAGWYKLATVPDLNVRPYLGFKDISNSGPHQIQLSRFRLRVIPK